LITCLILKLFHGYLYCLFEKGVSKKEAIYLSYPLKNRKKVARTEKTVFHAILELQKEIDEMQDFLAKLHKKVVSRCNFQIHEKIRFQYSTFDTPF